MTITLPKAKYWHLFLLTFGFLIPNACSNDNRPADEKYNVLFIGVDDLRPELACYGKDHIISPNIDQLAADGILFERAYVQQAVCAASRASMLTGCYPNTTGVDYPYSKFFMEKFLLNHPSIPKHFHEQGYYTTAMGKMHHGGNYDMQKLSEPYYTRKGFHWKEQYALAENNILAMEGKNHSRPAVEMADLDDSVYKDGDMTNVAIKALQANSEKDEPFFLAVGFAKPHLPFVAPKKYWDLYDRDKIELASVLSLPEGAPKYAITNYELNGYAGEWGKNHVRVPDSVALELKHGYYACVSFVDAQIGKILAELDRLGLRDNTVIVFWSDHGFQLGDQGNWTKHTNYELATHSPLIISYPGMKKKGSRTASLVEYVDIFPTICDLTGVTPPEYLEGVSLLPLMEKPGRDWKKAAFSQYPRGGGLEGYAIRTDRYRYVEWRYDNGEIDATELYDHKTDPQESRSIADENPDLVNELSAILHKGWKESLPDGIENHSNNATAPIDWEKDQVEKKENIKN
jgi:iduronate 2-sulfatase